MPYPSSSPHTLSKNVIGWEIEDETRLAPMPPVRDMANQLQKLYFGLASFPPILTSPIFENISTRQSMNRASVMSWYSQPKFS